MKELLRTLIKHRGVLLAVLAVLLGLDGRTGESGLDPRTAEILAEIVGQMEGRIVEIEQAGVSADQQLVIDTAETIDAQRQTIASLETELSALRQQVALSDVATAELDLARTNLARLRDELALAQEGAAEAAKTCMALEAVQAEEPRDDQICFARDDWDRSVGGGVGMLDSAGDLGPAASLRD